VIHAIVLAAGESRRMGRPKMLLPWGRSTMLETVVRTLLSGPFATVVVVLGHRAEEHGRALAPLAEEPRVRLAVNPRYPEGMLTSLQCGVRAAGAGTVLVALGDQPLITAETVVRVLAAHGTGLTVPTFRGRRGHPVCIDERLVQPLLALRPEQGLRGLFRRHPGAVTLVEAPGEEILVDLDTPEAYRRAVASGPVGG